MTDVDVQFVDRTVEALGRRTESLIAILQAIQEHYRWLPEPALRRVCEITDITPARIQAVSTFYTQFRHRPVGRHIISVCHGTACHVKGAQRVHDALLRHLGLAGDEDTDSDGLFTVQKVACLGCCTLAPAVQIDAVTYGHLTADTAPQMLQDFLDLQNAPRRGDLDGAAKQAGPPTAQPTGEIRIGLGSCCIARGSDGVSQALREALAETGAAVSLKQVGCVGICHQTPLVEVLPADGPSAMYAAVSPKDAAAIVRRHFPPAGLGRRISLAVGAALENLLTDEAWTPIDRYAMEVRDPPVAAFMGPQKHIATEHYGHLDPTDLDEYLGLNGFRALRQCVENLSGRQVIDQVRRSGLRGRGGAGYHTGTKWASVHESPGDKKYVVCNGDEGDPGAFMDRMLLESYPYRIIEGIAIAAFAVGADEGILYIRAEYPLAVQRMTDAIRRCREQSLLGENIFGSGFSLDLRVMQGAGAFVCGEETALLASIEGRRGTPRLRPPYPSAVGLRGKPTLVNNVETFAAAPWIIRNGPDAFAALGTETSRGTKVFSLAGKVARGGLIEVPMGTSLREIVEDIGGGIGAGKSFKAVQVGGPSGGCIPAAMSDVPVDYEALTASGAIMGSGGLVVLDETDCMVEIARYFLQFTQDQSCGQCTFCRIGTRRMLDILDRLCAGAGRSGDLEKLEQLAVAVQRGSLCGLGKTAPNPVLSTLRHFRDEYEAHLEKRCPAHQCKALIRYTITDDCIGCTLCAQHCPADAIVMRPFEKHEIDESKCIRCDTCRGVCPSEAVKVE